MQAPTAPFKPPLVCPHCRGACEELVVHAVGYIEYAWDEQAGRYRVTGTPDREAMSPEYRSACCDTAFPDADQARVGSLLAPVATPF